MAVIPQIVYLTNYAATQDRILAFSIPTFRKFFGTISFCQHLLRITGIKVVCLSFQIICPGAQ